MARNKTPNPAEYELELAAWLEEQKTKPYVSSRYTRGKHGTLKRTARREVMCLTKSDILGESS